MRITWRVVGLNQQANITACTVKKHLVNVQQLLILVCIKHKNGVHIEDIHCTPHSVCCQHHSFYSVQYNCRQPAQLQAISTTSATACNQCNCRQPAQLQATSATAGNQGNCGNQCNCMQPVQLQATSATAGNQCNCSTGRFICLMQFMTLSSAKS